MPSEDTAGRRGPPHTGGRWRGTTEPGFVCMHTAQLTRDLLAIAKFQFEFEMPLKLSLQKFNSSLDPGLHTLLLCFCASLPFCDDIRPGAGNN